MQERAVFYKPFYDGYANNYNVWKDSGGTQKGDTLTLDQLLALTTQKLDNWDPQIQIVLPKSSGGYLKLFPQGRRPFTHGKKDLQIKAFETLATALKATAALKSVQTDVQAFYQQLIDQRSLQQQSKNNTGTNSDNVEAARVAACDAMFCNLGMIMGYYYKERNRIGGLFDLENIRRHEQVIFQRHIKPLETLFIVKHKFAVNDIITITSKSVTKLYVFEGDSKTAVFNEATSIGFGPGEILKIEAGTLGAPDKAYLFVYNPDGINEGECEINFM